MGRKTTVHITTLLGSARKKGNTATVLGWVEAEVTNLGHSVERIYLNAKTIGGCLGCGKCKEKPDQIACVQNDDTAAVLEQMIASDAVLFSSPVYFWGFTAQIKRLIDRGYALVTDYHQPGHSSLMQDKPIGLLVTGADAYENNAEGLFTAFDRIADFLLAPKKGELYVGGCTNPAELPASVRTKAGALARSMVG